MWLCAHNENLGAFTMTTMTTTLYKHSIQKGPERAMRIYMPFSIKTSIVNCVKTLSQKAPKKFRVTKFMLQAASLQTSLPFIDVLFSRISDA